MVPPSVWALKAPRYLLPRHRDVSRRQSWPPHTTLRYSFLPWSTLHHTSTHHQPHFSPPSDDSLKQHKTVILPHLISRSNTGTSKDPGSAVVTRQTHGKASTALVLVPYRAHTSENYLNTSKGQLKCLYPPEPNNTTSFISATYSPTFAKFNHLTRLEKEFHFSNNTVPLCYRRIPTLSCFC